MSPPADKKALELFERALTLAPWEREAFLTAACADDRDLRSDVESLLAHDRAADSYLATPILEVEGAAGELPDPRTVGSYRLDEKLGEGGMGQVFLGRRVDAPFEQEVAIKVLRASLASEDARRRLLLESQILASLDHPNIARLIDGGTSDDGSPFFVMELVAGIPITTYCEQHRLSVRRRIELFLTVCDAVQYAHQRLVVHRDLTPSNVLVTDDGEPKVLDFGIAKILGSPAETRHRTVTGERIFTPEYASPEQVLGHPITTASDAFSLGVLLFELLTGSRPYPAEPALSPAEWARQVGERAPPRASVVVERHGADGAGGLPGMTRKELRQRLRGDLDTILAKALLSDPDRRYPAVADLAEDLRRYLQGRPILAHPPSYRYVVGKWLGRHARAAVAGAAILVLLLGVAVFSTIQSQRLERQRSIAELASEEEQLQRRRAEQVVRFLVEILADRDPTAGRSHAITVEEMLDLGARRASLELGDDPALQATLLQTIGTVYRGVGLVDRSFELTEQALTMRRHRGSDPHEVAESLGELAATQRDMGQLRAAMQSLREAVLVRASQGSMSPPLLAAGHHLFNTSPQATSSTISTGTLAADEDFSQHFPFDVDLLVTTGSVLRELGDFEASLQAFESALVLTREHYGSSHLKVTERLTDLATLQTDLQLLDEAESSYREALLQYETLAPKMHPAVAAARTSFSILLRDRGKLDEAEIEARKAVELHDRLYGQDHYLYAISLNNLAIALEGRGKLDEAESLHHQALEIEITALGSEHPRVATQWNNLAIVWQRLGRLEDAERGFRESLSIRRQSLGREHAHSTQTALNLANLLRRRREFAEARQLTTEATEILIRLHGSGHPEVARAFNGLVYQSLEESKYVEAEELARRVVASYRDAFGPSSWRTAVAEGRLGVALAAQGKSGESRERLLAAAQNLSGTDVGAHYLREMERLLRHAADEQGVPQERFVGWLGESARSPR